MRRTWIVILAGVFSLVFAADRGRCADLSLTEAITVVAEKLVADQNSTPDDWFQGTWPGESQVTGSILTGLVGAYDTTCDGDYVTSMQYSGLFIQDTVALYYDGLFLGEEAVALARLSEILQNSDWRAPVEYFYNDTVKHGWPDGTLAYAWTTEDVDLSMVMIANAHHTIASYMVGAEDAGIWRNVLIEQLARISDSSHALPGLALYTATWALVITGPMDDTLVDATGDGGPFFSGVRLSDLPLLVADHQVPVGDPNAGSFYWRLDKTDGGEPYASAGYLYEMAFATHALIVSRDYLGLDFDEPIRRASEALLRMIEPNGNVRTHLVATSATDSASAGDLLSALSEVITAGDLSLNGRVDGEDFAIFVDSWLETGCTGCSWCSGADIDRNGVVDFSDLEIFAGVYWLSGAGGGSN